jgi:hypothetical protein
MEAYMAGSGKMNQGVDFLIFRLDPLFPYFKAHPIQSYELTL